MTQIKKHLSSKKLLVFLFVAIGGTVIWYLSDESVFNDWSNFIMWTTGIYVTGNVGEHGAKAIKREPSINGDMG